MMNTKTKTLFLAPFAITLAWSTVGQAFPTGEFFHMPASGEAGVNRAGAGGIYGTGGKQDYGIKCSHCHTKSEGKISMQLEIKKGNAGSPTGWDDVGGLDGYAPGARYTITVKMIGEHKRDPSEFDINGMSATFEDQSGKLAGVLYSDAGQNSNSCPPNYPYQDDEFTSAGGATTLLYGDCHATLFISPSAGALQSWTFDWVAPAAGTGDVTLYVGVVDGNNHGESSLEDDVVEKSFVLVEGP